MSHRRPPLKRALKLNTGVMVVEIAAGRDRGSAALAAQRVDKRRIYDRS